MLPDTCAKKSPEIRTRRARTQAVSRQRPPAHTKAWFPLNRKRCKRRKNRSAIIATIWRRRCFPKNRISAQPDVSGVFPRSGFPDQFSLNTLILVYCASRKSFIGSFHKIVSARVVAVVVAKIANNLSLRLYRKSRNCRHNSRFH